MKKTAMLLVLALLLSCLIGCGGNNTPAPAASQAPQSAAPELKYPEKEITFICPFSAGGGVDVNGRLMAARLEKLLG